MSPNSKPKSYLQSITEGTLVPLGLAISIIGGGDGWMTTMYVKQEALAAWVDRQADFMREVRNTLTEMNQRLSNIEGKLEVISHKRR